MYPIDIRILGEEYRDKDFTGKDICRKRDIKLHFNKRDHRFSTSDLPMIGLKSGVQGLNPHQCSICGQFNASGNNNRIPS